MQTAQDLGLTGRRAQVWDRLVRGTAPKDIAVELGMNRNAVYQHIGRFKREGLLPNGNGGGKRAHVPAPTPDVPVQESVGQFIDSLNARLEKIESEEDRCNDRLSTLRTERDNIARLVDTLRHETQGGGVSNN